MIVSVMNLSQTEIEKMSMVDLANLIFAEEQRPMSFKEAYDKIATLKKWNQTEKDEKVAQFYTDLNIDGRFVTNGSNSWGLKRWYRSEQIREDLSMDDLEDMIEDEDEEEVLAAEEEVDIDGESLEEEDYDRLDGDDVDLEDETFAENFGETYEGDFDDS